MAIPNNKQELEQSIKTSFDKIFADYSNIPAALARNLEIEGNVKNTQISTSDTLAYLIGWGKLVLKWHTLKKSGQSVDLPDTGYKWNQLGELAQKFHHEYKDWEYADLLCEFLTTTTNILKLITSLDNKDLYDVFWYKKYTLGRMIQLNTSSPMKNMRSKVRKFNKSHDLKSRR